jgi:hypothetical protein
MITCFLRGGGGDLIIAGLPLVKFDKRPILLATGDILVLETKGLK